MKTCGCCCDRPPDEPGRARYFELQRLARQQGRDTQQLAGDVGSVRDLVADLAAVPLEDGLQFDAAGATAQVIRDDEEYSGVRVALDATLHTARLKIKVDVNIGDPIWPAPREVTVPRLLEGQPLILRGYPLHMVLAEKLVTAIDRGTANTRWRDFADVYMLARQHPVYASDLDQAIRRVADYRLVALAPLGEVLEGLPELGQAKWAAWRAQQDLTDRLPAEFVDVVDEVIAFADPVLERGAPDAAVAWDPAARRWAT